MRLFFNFISALNFSVIMETMNMGGNITPSQCGTFVGGVMADDDKTSLASFTDFLICIPLILFVFKK